MPPPGLSAKPFINRAMLEHDRLSDTSPPRKGPHECGTVLPHSQNVNLPHSRLRGKQPEASAGNTDHPEHLLLKCLRDSPVFRPQLPERFALEGICQSGSGSQVSRPNPELNAAGESPGVRPCGSSTAGTECFMDAESRKESHTARLREHFSENPVFPA